MKRNWERLEQTPRAWIARRSDWRAIEAISATSASGSHTKRRHGASQPSIASTGLKSSYRNGRQIKGRQKQRQKRYLYSIENAADL
jgi:hypothetical protein